LHDFTSRLGLLLTSNSYEKFHYFLSVGIMPNVSPWVFGLPCPQPITEVIKNGDVYESY
jgi:hypothetical protein